MMIDFLISSGSPKFIIILRITRLQINQSCAGAPRSKLAGYSTEIKNPENNEKSLNSSLYMQLF